MAEQNIGSGMRTRSARHVCAAALVVSAISSASTDSVAQSAPGFVEVTIAGDAPQTHVVSRTISASSEQRAALIRALRDADQFSRANVLPALEDADIGAIFDVVVPQALVEWVDADRIVLYHPFLQVFITLWRREGQWVAGLTVAETLTGSVLRPTEADSADFENRFFILPAVAARTFAARMRQAAPNGGLEHLGFVADGTAAEASEVMFRFASYLRAKASETETACRSAAIRHLATQMRSASGYRRFPTDLLTTLRVSFVRTQPIEGSTSERAEFVAFTDATAGRLLVTVTGRASQRDCQIVSDRIIGLF